MRAFYHPGYFLPLPPGHPFPMEKFPGAYALLLAEAGMALQVEGVEPAPWEDLCRVHTEAYLHSIRDGTLSSYDRNRLGLPHHRRLLERSRLETAGTIAAVRAALADGLAANLAGGTHHAFPDRGLGYCVLNDVAVAIRALHAEDPGLHVIVIDTDAHQGNGTHAIFRDDDRVYTWSIHVGRNYPTRKEPGDEDHGLERWVTGEVYLETLCTHLPTALERAEPDLAIWISGADPHAEDRFGQMKLTRAEMAARDRFVLEACRRWRIPVATLYGGGYHRTAGMTARLHADSVLATLAQAAQEATATAARASGS